MPKIEIDTASYVVRLKAKVAELMIENQILGEELDKRLAADTAAEKQAMQSTAADEARVAAVAQEMGAFQRVADQVNGVGKR